MTDDTTADRYWINVPGFRSRGRRLGGDQWVTQYDGVTRPVTAADLQHRDEMARDVAGRECEARATLRSTDPNNPADRAVRAAALRAISVYGSIQRELAQLYSSGGDATSTRHCSPLPVRRNTRRTPRRTRSARTARATTNSSSDGEPPEPEPPGNRRCPSLGAAPVEISTEHAPDPAHRGALVDLLVDLIGGGR